ncbi:4609_t:CDS:2 [Ambispora gerdemannii]|uniref:4609_t:CDS:1 n=1 Tax=Ambispora gerdemannii TaxID=144530 RepID=A0A9N9B4U6_9GLOM|nr:4609_t:CDS:2 [Ambispora gerdemannii]
MGCCSSKNSAFDKKDENEKQYQQQTEQITPSSPKPSSRHVSLRRNGTKLRKAKNVESDPLEDEDNHLAKYFKRTSSSKISRKASNPLQILKTRKSKSITSIKSNSIHDDTPSYQHQQYQFEHDEKDTLSVNFNYFIDYDKFSQISGRNVESKRATISDVNETTTDVYSYSKKSKQHSITHDDCEGYSASVAKTQTQQLTPKRRPSARFLQRKGTLNRHAKLYEQRDYRKSFPQQSTTLEHYLAYNQECDNKRRSMGNKASQDSISNSFMQSIVTINRQFEVLSENLEQPINNLQHRSISQTPTGWDENVSSTMTTTIDQSQNTSMRIKGKSALHQSTDSYRSFNSSTDDKQQSETRPKVQLRLSAEQVALLEKADEQFANDLLNSNLNGAHTQDDFVQVQSPTWSMAISDDDTENIQFCHGQLEKLMPVEAILTPVHNIKRLSRRASNGKKLNLSDPKIRETLISLNEDTDQSTFSISVSSSSKKPEIKIELPTVDLTKSLDSDDHKNNNKSRNPEIRPKTIYGTKLSNYGESILRASQIKRFSAGNERPLSPNFERFISFDVNGVKRVTSVATDNQIPHRESISSTRHSIRSKRRSTHSDDEIDDYLDLGNCQQCRRPNTGVEWCKNCNAKHFADDFSKWDSGVDEVNGFIKSTQLSAENSMRIIEWISFDRFINIENIGNGGYSIVDKATLIGGRIRAWDHDYKRWSRYGNHVVVLKRLLNLKRMTLTFLSELKMQWNIVSSDMPTWFGITRDPTTQDFILVIEYIDGNLHSYLQKSFSQITWTSKVEILHDLTWILWTIHESGIVHQDLHSSNILWESGSPKISDLGLSHFIRSSQNQVYGVLPYVPPEVLLGNLSFAKQFENAERLRVNAMLVGDKIEQHPKAIYTSRPLPVVSESGEKLEKCSDDTRISAPITLTKSTDATNHPDIVC